MRANVKSAMIGLILLGGCALSAHAQTGPSLASVPLPGPRVSSYGTIRSEHYQPPLDYDTNAGLHPYTSGLSSRASSNGTVRVEHYHPPPDYDAKDALHPYTSGLSPCQGACAPSASRNSR